MLEKKYRSLKESLVSELFERKMVKSVANRFFRMNWKEVDQNFPQFVVIITPKVEKTAVKRNRLRRQIYEMLRLNWKDWTVGKRVAILVKKSATTCSREDLKKYLLELFNQII